jgi:hypothetical protein
MDCPTCDSANGQGHGRQIAHLSESYVEGEVVEYDINDWGERLGLWEWECRDCGHQWTHVPHTQAQWIGEAALQAEDAYRAGDYDTLKACLEAIQMHASDLGYIQPSPEERSWLSH